MMYKSAVCDGAKLQVSLGVSILVAISVFLLLVAGNVPDTSDAIPIIGMKLFYIFLTDQSCVT